MDLYELLTGKLVYTNRPDEELSIWDRTKEELEVRRGAIGYDSFTQTG